MVLQLIALGGLLVYIGLKKQKTKKHIQFTPTSKTRSAAMGLVELKGEVAEQQELYTSPLRKHTCVYYQWTIEQYNFLRIRWDTIASGSQRSHFYLKDKTGKVRVELSRVIPDLEYVYDRRPNIFSQLRNETKKLLRDSGNSSFGHGIIGFMRVREQTLRPGDEVYVIGTATDNPYIKDGTETTKAKDIMITRGEHNTEFYITNRDEHKATSTLHKQSLAYLLAGIICILVGIILTFA